MLKMPETIVRGDIGLVLLSGLGSRRTHPVGTEGATMARRAPFPLSSIPAYIDQSMKLIVYLDYAVAKKEAHVLFESFPISKRLCVDCQVKRTFAGIVNHTRLGNGQINARHARRILGASS